MLHYLEKATELLRVSPVCIITFMCAFLHLVTDYGEEMRGGSLKENVPIYVKFFKSKF